MLAQYAIETVKVLSKTAEIDKKQQNNCCNLLIFRCRKLKFKANLEYFHSLASKPPQFGKSRQGLNIIGFDYGGLPNDESTLRVKEQIQFF